MEVVPNRAFLLPHLHTRQCVLIYSESWQRNPTNRRQENERHRRCERSAICCERLIVRLMLPRKCDGRGANCWALLKRNRSMADTAEPKPVMNATDAADYLQLSKRTLYALSYPRGPIPAIRPSPRVVRYSLAALQEWIRQQGSTT
jgi:hypothetical protein